MVKGCTASDTSIPMLEAQRRSFRRVLGGMSCIEAVEESCEETLRKKTKIPTK